MFSSHQMDKLKVTLPKFSIRGSLELNEPLASLNISKLFGPGEDHDGGGGNDGDDDADNNDGGHDDDNYHDDHDQDHDCPGSNLTGFIDLEATPVDQVGGRLPMQIVLRKMEKIGSSKVGVPTEIQMKKICLT